ncbi:MAG: diguanylate cyclase [Candidatus Omnitrophica bacterium]|nr:diguanylate cyclase [Candidatus Omnitrophota bacterium]
MKKVIIKNSGIDEIKIGDDSSDKITRVMLDNVMMGISIIGPDMKISWMNKTFKKWFPKIDLKKRPLCYKSFYSPAKDNICDYCPTIKAFKTWQHTSSQTGVCSNGRIYNVVATPVKDPGGKTSFVIETVEDITVRKRIEEALKESESHYQTLIDSLGEAIHVVDRNLRFILFNTTFKNWNQRLGLETDAIGRKLLEIFPFLPDSIKSEYQKIFNNGKIIVSEDRNKIGTREIITETRKIPVFEGEKVVRVITVVNDITEHKRRDKKLQILNKELIKSNKRLKQMVLRDPHTGLYNHRYLGEIIEAEFFRAKRSNHPLSVVMIDIDYFRSINEVYGHKFGDLILKQFALQLKKALRQYDIIIRFGGEEFVVISPGTDRNTVYMMSQRLIESTNLSVFGNKKYSVKLKLSMGVASYPEDRAIMGMDLVELSEKVVSKVKESGGNNVFSSLDLGKQKLPGSEKSEKTVDVGLLKDRIDRLTKEANQSLIEAVLAFAKTIELKDHYTGDHVEKTVHYAMEIAKGLNLSKEEAERIKQAAILHDLGKIGISEKILLKKGKLSTKEYDEIKKHPRIGVDIIRPIQFLHGLIPLILYHHERWDGRGYPNGLSGDDIPLGARIIALADVYQALTSDRPYRKAFTKEEAIKIILEGSGTQFDPEIVTVFLKILEKE